MTSSALSTVFSLIIPAVASPIPLLSPPRSVSQAIWRASSVILWGDDVLSLSSARIDCMRAAQTSTFWSYFQGLNCEVRDRVPIRLRHMRRKLDFPDPHGPNIPTTHGNGRSEEHTS